MTDSTGAEILAAAPAPRTPTDADFRALADNLPTLCWIADATGWIYWYNRRWYDYTGTSPEQMEGWGWQSVHDPAALPSVLERWTGSVASGQPFEMVFPLKGADGVFRPFLTRITPFHDESGAITHWFGTNSDISEQLEAERAKSQLERTRASLEKLVAQRTADLHESNEEMQRYAYIVSHDLRAPLVNIMGFTGELEALRADFAAISTAGDAAQREGTFREFDEALAFIKAAIAKMEGLISAILRLSREGRRNLKPTSLDMTRLVRGLVDAQQHQIEGAGARVDVGPLPPIEGDEVAVGQVFGNLIDNAVKYRAKDRPVQIDVSGERQGAMAVFRVRDTGRGIAAGDLGRVFELFRRAGVQDRPGEGIGLAHVRSLVRSMGGRIALESSENVGTTFTVSLPAQATARNA